MHSSITHSRSQQQWHKHSRLKAYRAAGHPKLLLQSSLVLFTGLYSKDHRSNIWISKSREIYIPDDHMALDINIHLFLVFSEAFLRLFLGFEPRNAQVHEGLMAF